MAPGNHKVKTQRMELTFGNEARAGELHAVVRELCCNEIRKALEQILESFSPSGSTIYSFRKIELNVGSIDLNDLNNTLPKRIAQELTKALKTAFVDLNTDHEIDMRVVADSDLRSITHYLRHGFLPWNARNQDLGSMLLESIKTTPGEFAVSIRQLGVALQVRTRLVERFNPEVLRRIIGILEPGNATMIIGYHQHLSTLNKREMVVDAPQEGLEKILWLFVFNHLLTEQGSDFNRKTFALSVLRQFSCHFNIRFDDLLLLLHSALYRWKSEVPKPFSHLIGEIISDWIPSSDEHLKPISHKAETDPSPDGRRNANSPDDLFNSLSWKKTVSDLLDSEPGGMLSLLRMVKDKPRIIHKIVSEGKPSLTKRILKSIAPVESSTIVKYHSNLVAIHSADPIPNTRQHEVENILWTFMILHIVETHESYFNYKSFLRSLIFSFSVHYNLVEAELLEKLIRSARVLPAQSAGMRRFLSIITEIYAEVTEQSASAGELRVDANRNKQETLSYLLASAPKTPIGPEYEESILQVLHTRDAGSIATLKKHLRYDHVRTRFSLFSKASFSKLVQYLLSPPTIPLVNQYMTLFSRLEKQMVPYFGTKEHYNKAVRLSILEIVETVERLSINHSKVFDLLVRSLVSRASRLSVGQVHTFASFYRDTPQLYLVGKLIKSNPIDSSLEETEPVVTQLVNGVLSFFADGGDKNVYPGFTTMEEALAFLQSRHPGALRRAISKLSAHKQKEFFGNLGHTELDLLMSMKEERSITWYSDVILAWEKQLIGLNNRGEIAAALKRAVLTGYVFQRNPSVDVLASSLLAVFERYRIPDGFFESLAKWSLPKFGDASKSILSIERKILGRDSNVPTLKKKEKLNLIREALHEANAKARRAKEIAPKPDVTNEIFIGNAGLVLVHPYLAFLFEHSGLMKDGKFLDPESALRAIAMLHYASTGLEAFKEEDHVLNKVLCGVNVQENSIQAELTGTEKEMINSMLRAFAEHWSVIKNSTEDDVRGNWLIREGKLSETEECWELTVKRQPYDLLMDSLPFTLSPIKYPWMKKMIMIQW